MHDVFSVYTVVSVMADDLVCIQLLVSWLMIVVLYLLVIDETNSDVM